MAAPKKWDRPGILAELTRKRLTLTGLARDNGLHEGACRAGICGRSYKGAMVIAEALGVPIEELFPDSYIKKRPENRNQKTAPSPSQNGLVSSDSARAA